MSQSITLERVSQRIYFRGNTFPLKDALKSLGAHWDGEARAWWIGASKEAQARQLLDDSAASTTRDPVERVVLANRAEEAGKDSLAAELRAAPPAEDVSEKRVYAAVTYKGRRYYVIAEQRNAAGEPTRCRLATLDADGPVFWADCSACTLIRTYEGREQWDGRRYSGQTRTVYSTIGSLRRFRDRARAADACGEVLPESLGPRTGCSCGSREGGSQPSDCRSCRFDQDDN